MFTAVSPNPANMFVCFLLLPSLHNYPMYLVCPDMLSPVGERLLGDRCASANYILLSLFTYCFIYSFYS
jgi:hypothetical protein